MTRVDIELPNLKDVQADLTKALWRTGRPLTDKFLVTAMVTTSAHAAPYVPVHTSNLINSEYRTIERRGDRVAGEIGFSAEYAAAVHDGPQKNWRKSGASNRFLALGLQDFLDQDLDNLLEELFGGDA